MTRFSRLLGIAALAAVPSLTHAQSSMTSRPISFGVMGGASLPIGDFGDGADVGYTLGANVLLKPASLANLNFRGDVTYDRWSGKGVGQQLVAGNVGTIGVMANVILKSSSDMSIKPYAIGGVGLLSTKFSGSVAGVGFSTDRQNDLGVQAGGGLEFKLSGFTTFIEAKFVNAFSDGKSTNWIPVTFGIRF